MDQLFEVKVSKDTNEQLKAAVKQVSTKEGVKQLFQTAASFDLLKFVVDNKKSLGMAVLENSRKAKYQEVVSSPATAEFAKLTGSTVEKLAEKAAAEYMSTMKLPSYLVIEEESEDKPVRERKARPPIFKVQLEDGTVLQHAGGGQVKGDVADYLWEQVKGEKSIDAKSKKMAEIINQHKVEGAEKSKLDNMVPAVIASKTMIFSIKDANGNTLEWNSRTRVQDNLVNAIREAVNKGKKVADFYVKNELYSEEEKKKQIADMEDKVFTE
ncbi:hypothetical protein H5203_21610 [Pseudoalteromonas sp. SG41-1]|uniref:hypothetical protein n=1 Tax=Pseudoalteromonas sp. SG41-1 TaxID=2760979 RepID=UPI00160309FF|nr:hypothetical protein [Pseudoalteromonas sp. SG41-1]MBB1508043.1 hypothetical protein [Pseudoalteromonas sp. SG41-1]